MSKSKKPTRGGQSARNSREQLRLQQEEAARRRRRTRLLGIVALVVVVLVVAGGIVLQRSRTTGTPTAGGTPVSSFAPVTIAAGKPIVLGEASAPVRMQLYEDFHCPHCAEFEERVGPTITAEQKSGRVAVELYPMSFIDAGSASAANAMACAAERGFGEAYYLGLFANHTLEWSDEQLVSLAGQVASPVPSSFNTCVTGKQHQDWVQSINQTASANNVSSTPTMFINGKAVDVEVTAAQLTALVDQAAGAK